MFSLVALLFRPFLTDNWKRRPVDWLGMVMLVFVAAYITVFVLGAIIRQIVGQPGTGGNSSSWRTSSGSVCSEPSSPYRSLPDERRSRSLAFQRGDDGASRAQ